MSATEIDLNSHERYDEDRNKSCTCDGIPAMLIGHHISAANELFLVVRTKLGEIKMVAPATIHLNVDPEEWETDEEEPDDLPAPRRRLR